MLPLGRKHWCKDTGWGLPGWEQLFRKGPGGLGRHRLSISQQCALAAETTSSLGDIHSSTGRTSKGGIIALCFALVRSHVNTVSSLSSQEKYRTKMT